MNYTPRSLVARLGLIFIVLLVIVACNSDEATPELQPVAGAAVVATPAPPPTAAPIPTAVEVPPTAAPTEVPPIEATSDAPMVASANRPVLSDLAPLPAQCGWGKVVIAQNATVIRAAPDLKPGELFATSGGFAEKPVDEPCDTAPGIGPFPVSAGGSLVARLTGSPPAPNKWSLYNSGVAMSIIYEPLLGEGQYGPGQKVVEFAIPAEKTEAEMGGSWSGPGRLSASFGAAQGSGPLTGSCFEQSYTAMAEIVEVHEQGPLQPGMTLHDGDTIITEPVWGEVVIAGSNDRIAPGSEVQFNLFGQQAPIREGTADLSTGQQPDYWNDNATLVGQKLQEFQKAGYLLPANTSLVDYTTLTLDMAHAQIQDIKDPCLAALELKLFLDAQPQGFHKKVADMLTDVAAIWLLPNNWDAMDGWGKWAFGQLPGVSYISKAQNVLDTWDRVKKEWIPTVAEQKATWTLAAYEEYKGQQWSEAQIEEQQRQRQQQSEKKRADIERLRQNFEEMVPTLTAATEAEVAEIRADADARLAKIDAETQPAFEALKQELAAMPDESPDAPQIQGRKSLKQIREDEFWEAWRRKRAVVVLERDAAITAVEAPFYLQMQGLANEYERAVTQNLTDMARLQIEREALESYAKPLARKDCPGVKPQKVAPPPDPCAGNKLIEMGLKKGLVHIIERKGGQGAKTAYQTMTINLGTRREQVWPDGTEYSVEMQGEDTALVRVYDGRVVITSDDGSAITVEAGQQAALPGGETTALSPDAYPLIDGIPLAELRLDSGLPEPYGVTELRAEGGALPPDWLWQEPNKNLNDPGDATLEMIGADSLRVTVPNENEFYGYRSDAPRLLHKVTGDFDLEAEMLLESAGTHFASSEFLIFTPDLPLGYVHGQMNAGNLGANYFLPGGAWVHWEGQNKLGVVNREWSAAADAPDGPIRVRLSRRDDQLKAYWSADDGATWTLASRHEMALPETLWTGWLFKRMAFDGLNDEPARITLSDVRLTSAPPDTLTDNNWDFADHAGMVVTAGNELLMTQGGSAPSYVQAFSPWAIAGDFDLIVAFDAPPVEAAPEQERYIHVAVASNDGKNHAYVRNALTPDWHRYDADMAINEGWNRYRSEDTQESAGRVRLARVDGDITGYYWKDGDWVKLADWQEGFADPVYLDLRYQWKTPAPTLGSTRFTIERLETEDGVLIGTDAGAQASPGLDENPPEAGPVASPTTTIAQPLTPTPDAETPTAECTEAVDPQIAPQWDRAALGCSTAPAQATWAAVQPFENGLMLWREDTALIYTFYDSSGWASWPDIWNDGIRTPGRGAPPQGLQAPERGFGFIWATEPEVFRNLGWARWDESGMCATIQQFEKGVVIARNGVETCDRRLNPLASNWFGSVEAYDNGGWR